LNCEHCFYASEIKRPNSREEAIDLGDYKKIAQSLKKPLVNLILTGGEPFLEKNIVEIIKIFNDFNKTRQITIPTNGFATELVINKIKEILTFFKGNLHIQISLDGIGLEHDEIRRVANTFERAVKTIQDLRELSLNRKNLTIGVNTTISSRNYQSIEDLSNYIDDKLLVSQNFELIRGTDFLEGVENKDVLSNFRPDDVNLLVPDDGQINKIINKLNYIFYFNSRNAKDIKALLKPLFFAAKITVFHFYRKILKNKKPINHLCKAGKKTGVIYPNGDFAVCELTKTIVNLQEYNFDLYKIWNDKKIRDFTKKLDCYCTHGCFVSQSFIYDFKMDLRFISEVFRYFYLKLRYGNKGRK